MRSLPQSIEAEQSVLGSMITDKNAVVEAVEKLEENDFYRDGHNVILRPSLKCLKRHASRPCYFARKIKGY